MSTTNNQQITLAEMRPKAPEAPQRYAISLTDSQGFELAQRVAKLLASSQLVPKEYQGNTPNCVIALNMAQRIGADPLMVMQNLVVVYGKPTWSSQFLIATTNTCGRFSPIRYEFFGQPNTDDWGCRAWAVEKATGKELVGADITIAIAKKEGWYGKNGSKWQSIPQQMLMYRAGAWWTRAYAPEISMGMQTAEEVADTIDLNPDGSILSVTTESLRAREVRSEVAHEATPDAEPQEEQPQATAAPPLVTAPGKQAATQAIEMAEATRHAASQTTAHGQKAMRKTREPGEEG